MNVRAQLAKKVRLDEVNMRRGLAPRPGTKGAALNLESHRAIEAAIQLRRRHAAGAALPLDTRSACTLLLALCRTGRHEEAAAIEAGNGRGA